MRLATLPTAAFCLLPAEAHDLCGVPDLLDGLEAGHMVADRAFGADWWRENLYQQDIRLVIPPRKNRKQPAVHGEEMPKWRHLVESFLQKFKDNRGIATRYRKSDTSFSAFISLAAPVLWLKCTSTDPSNKNLKARRLRTEFPFSKGHKAPVSHAGTCYPKRLTIETGLLGLRTGSASKSLATGARRTSRPPAHRLPWRCSDHES